MEKMRSGTVQGAAEGHTKRICSFLPVACANFFSVANDGPLWPEAKLLSMRVIAVALVPIRSATCAWVRPAFLRATSISSSKANSSSMASYSALNAGSSIHFATISSCVIVSGVRLPAMLYLLHSGFGLITFSDWSLLSFLDEAVQHDYAFACESAVKHSGDTIAAFDSKLKKSIPKSACVRFTEITTVDFHAFNEMLVPNSHAQWKSVNLKLNLFAVVLNSIVHVAKYNKIVIFVQVLDHLNSGRYTVLAAAKSAVGIGVPEFLTAHDRANAVFLCAEHCHISTMVGRAGQPQGWPGSVGTGYANPVRLTTLGIGVSGGEFLKLPTEAANMATIPTLSQPDITIINGRAVTTSLAVAEYFHKPHKDVLAKISRLDCSSEFNERNFSPVEYTDLKGECRPACNITRDGFAFLAMGFTGKRAAQFKEAYITAFNQMEKELAFKAGNLHPQIHTVIEEARRIQDKLEEALSLWKNHVAPLKPPVLVGGLLLDAVCTADRLAGHAGKLARGEYVRKGGISQ